MTNILQKNNSQYLHQVQHTYETKKNANMLKQN